jgi:hypothetical protein
MYSIIQMTVFVLRADGEARACARYSQLRQITSYRMIESSRPLTYNTYTADIRLG